MLKPESPVLTMVTQEASDCFLQMRSHSEASYLYRADLPKLKALWHDFHDAYDVEIYVVPTSPITSRPIDDMEPYTMHNGHKVNALHNSSKSCI